MNGTICYQLVYKYVEPYNIYIAKANSICSNATKFVKMYLSFGSATRRKHSSLFLAYLLSVLRTLLA